MLYNSWHFSKKNIWPWVYLYIAVSLKMSYLEFSDNGVVCTVRLVRLAKWSKSECTLELHKWTWLCLELSSCFLRSVTGSISLLLLPLRRVLRRKEVSRRSSRSACAFLIASHSVCSSVYPHLADTGALLLHSFIHIADDRRRVCCTLWAPFLRCHQQNNVLLTRWQSISLWPCVHQSFKTAEQTVTSKRIQA